MKSDQMAQLLEVTKALEENDAAVLSRIQTEEREIRDKLSALDARHRSMNSLPETETVALKSLGGDMLWQVWVGRRRRELQIQLAQVLARRGTAIQALRKSFGRRYALGNIKTAETKKKKHKTALEQDEAVTHLSVMQSHSQLE